MTEEERRRADAQARADEQETLGRVIIPKPAGHELDEDLPEYGFDDPEVREFLGLPPLDEADDRLP